MCVMGKNCTYFDKETSVRGELTTSDVIVEGSFEGKIMAKGNVLLKKTGDMNAEINTPKLMVEEGASYRGRLCLTND